MTITAFLILFGLFGVCFGDYFEYGALVKQAYKTYKEYNGPGWYLYIHMEPQYNYLSVWLHGNYVLWRFLWFFVEMAFLTYCFKKTGINSYDSYYMFSIMALESICAGRVSWGVTFFWMGLFAFFVTTKKRFLLFVLLSVFAHNSMALMFAMLPCVFLRLNKKIALTLLVLTPFLSIILSDLFVSRASYLSLFDSNGYMDFLEARFAHSAQNDENVNYWGNSISEKIHSTFYRLPLYYLMVRIFIDYFRKKLYLPGYTDRLITMTFFLFVYTCIALFGNLNSSSLYSRYFIMLYLPVYLIMYGLNRNYYKVRYDFKICTILLFLAFVIQYLSEAYIYYCHGIEIRAEI